MQHAQSDGEHLAQAFLQFLPTLLTAAAVLTVCWLVAEAVAQLFQATRQHQPSDAPPRRVRRMVWALTVGLFAGFFLLIGPVQVAQLFEESLGLVIELMPNLGAALLLVTAWLLAHLLGFLVRRAARDLDLDFDSDPGGVAFWLTFLVFLPGILQSLELRGWLAPLHYFVQRMLAALPVVLSVGLIVALGWLVGRVLEKAVTTMLATLGFDRNHSVSRLAPNVAGGESDGGRRPSEVAGKLVFIVVLLPVLLQALTVLELGSLTEMLVGLALLAGKLLLAVLFFVAGCYLAAFATAFIRPRDGDDRDLLPRTVHHTILVVAAYLALRQGGLPEDLLVLVIGLVVGAVALAASIAFGIGGRDAARRQVEHWHERMEGEEPEPPDGSLSGDAITAPSGSR